LRPFISPALVLNAGTGGTAGREPQRGETEVVAEGRRRGRVHAGLPLLGDGSSAPRVPLSLALRVLHILEEHPGGI